MSLKTFFSITIMIPISLQSSSFSFDAFSTFLQFLETNTAYEAYVRACETENLNPVSKKEFYRERYILKPLVERYLAGIHPISLFYPNANIRLGLCCINTELRKKGIYCSRTLIRRTFTLEKAKELALKNILNIIPLLEWNEENGIKHLRVSSDLFPRYTDDQVESYGMHFAKSALKKVGKLAKKLGHRITTHPGQFVQIAAKSEKVFQSSVKELEMHADFLDLMGMDNNAILCVHGGGLYGDKKSAIKRWISNFARLPKKIKDRLALENCEKCYSLDDCLYIAEKCGIPVIYDTHHYDCYGKLHPKESNPLELERVVQTWGDRVPLFHISEQAEGKRVGAHSDYIENIPIHIFELSHRLGCRIDIEVEAKMKEKAILKLYEKYSFLRM